jgi:hypothetical protein
MVLTQRPPLLSGNWDESYWKGPEYLHHERDGIVPLEPIRDSLVENRRR